jgi:transcriptional antiterminator RfaH
MATGEERVRILLEFLGRTSIVEVPAAKLLSDRAPREAMARKK